MPDTTNVSSPTSGMNSDTFAFNANQEYYRYALNASMEDFDGNSYVLSNSNSNVLAVNLPQGYRIIGREVITEQDRVIVMLVNPATGQSEIGEYRNCQYFGTTDLSGVAPCADCATPIKKENTPLEQVTQSPYCAYHTITNNICLGFDINHPVDIEYRITDCGLNIYFTDNFNERRKLYFDYLNNDVNDLLIVNKDFLKIIGYTNDECSEAIYSNELDCNKIKYHPSYKRPCVELVDRISGGNLKAGVYQVIVAYSDAVGNELTSYTPATNPTPIFDKFLTVSTDYVTNFSLKFKINNLDQSALYRYYNLVVAETIDNFTEFKLIGTFPVTTDEHTYTGNDAILKKLSSEEIFFKRPYYKTAKSITKANDYLFFSGLKQFEGYNLQRHASLIKLYWETIAIPEKVYFDPLNVNRFRTYQRDEVYAMAAVFEADNGEDLCAIHIPSNTASYFQTKYGINVNQVINNNDVINDLTCDPNRRDKNWQVYNLANVIGRPHNFTEKCEDAETWEYGEFAYWESSESYPNDEKTWGDLCGKKIRHFKFPDNSVSHIHDGKDTNKTFEDNNIVFPIGIRVDVNSVILMLQTALSEGTITQEQFDRIKGFRIVRANRVGNKSVVAKGLLYDVLDYSKNSKNYQFPNYPYNDLRPDVFISNDAGTYTVPDSNIDNQFRNTFRPHGRYTFHSPDVHFTNPRIGDEIKLETLEYGQSEGYFNECDEQAKYKFLSFASYLLSLATGFAAAASLTTEKECKVVTYKADYITKGEDGYGDVHGSVGGTWSFGGAGTMHGSTSTSGATIATTDTESHNNANGTLYDKTTGISFPNPNKVESEQITTCKGSTYQELNKPGFLSLLTQATGASESIQGLYYRISLGLFEMKKIIDLIEALVPFKNFALQYNSVGKYNNYKAIANGGNKRREVTNSAYLEPLVQLINEGNITINFNNWNRESSVYFKIGETKLFPSPSIQDTSRFTLGQVGNYDDVNKRFRATISSYYGSIKNYVPDQYSNIFKLSYLETNPCSIDLTPNTTKILFGGDTFITRFAIKRKHPFFLYTAFDRNNQSDIRYQDIGNAGYPNFYLNSGGTLFENLQGLNIGEILNPGNIPTLLGTPRNRLDVDTHPFFYQKGRIYLYSYGIPYFLVESDINTDYRHGTNTKEGDFYPHQQDLDFWLQEKNVPITYDNTYNYNTTYSKQNKESFICVNSASYSSDACKTEQSYKLIYSEQNDNNGSTYDNWLVFKANSYWDFPLTNGKLVTADGIENDKILVRFENTSSIFAAYNTLITDADNIQVGTGGLFQSKPKEFSKTDLGHMGTQHTTILHTEYGHVWADAKRGQVFILASNAAGLEDISQAGMKNWFKENLPFTITKHFPNVDIDNNYKGIGLHMSYDKRFNRLFLTKLDYRPINESVQFDGKDFYVAVGSHVIQTPTGPQLVQDKQFIELTDSKYFCNKSWTLSYNFVTKSWVSFHSFLPNVYIDWINYFQSYNGTNIWSHDITNKSYQVYYGKLQPFIVETHSKPELDKSYLMNVAFSLNAYRYHNEYDWFENELITFNKAIVYNNKQCSGLLKLVPTNPEDLSALGKYPRVNNGIEIEVSNSEGLWSINDFYDTTTSSTTNQPLFINNCANSNKDLNLKAITYSKPDTAKSLLRGDNFFVRLINDVHSNYKMLMKLTINAKRK